VVLASAGNWRTKNLPGAFKAVELAREKSGVNFQTAVYGSEEGLRRAEAEFGRPLPNLVTTGYIAPEELGMFFRNAHAFVMPSLYEGFGLPVLEAMSCGCAVVTSTGGSLPEVAGQGAQVFDPGDAEHMAEAVSAFLRDPQELSRWRERALARAADFSWSQAAEQTVSVYHRARRRNDGAGQE
jgi:glycosyltransferase involved in cell wall biosynthesis